MLVDRALPAARTDGGNAWPRHHDLITLSGDKAAPGGPAGSSAAKDLIQHITEIDESTLRVDKDQDRRARSDTEALPRSRQAGGEIANAAGAVAYARRYHATQAQRYSSAFRRWSDSFGIARVRLRERVRFRRAADSKIAAPGL